MRFEGDLDQFIGMEITNLTYIPEERRKIALEQALPELLREELKSLRVTYEAALEAKTDFCRVHGAAHDDMIADFVRKRDAYVDKIRSYRDSYPQFFSSVSRKQTSITPPPPPRGKHACGHTIPIQTSALTSFFPGNYPEYQKFLAAHNALYRAPESVASKGAIFTTPPQLDVQSHTLPLLEFMQRSHIHWREAPAVTLETTRTEVFRLLSHYDRHYTAFVFDHLAPGAAFRGVVDKEKAKELSGVATVRDFLSQDFHTEDNREIDPREALRNMWEQEVEYIVHFDEDGRPKIMTKMDAAMYARYKPFRDKEQSTRGLGFLVYIGVRDKEKSLADMDLLYRRGHRRFIIECAHMHRTDTIYHVLAEARERFPDCFIATGTTSTREGLSEMGRYADAVKVGIAFGGICDTNEVTIQPDEAKTMIEAGAAAQGVVSIIGDSLGNRKRFSAMIGTQECIAIQAGGAAVTRRDSANPIGLKDGHPLKRVDGEAGLDGVLRRKGGNGDDVESMIDATLGHHVEGRTDRWKRMRSPDTLGPFFNEVLQAPCSTETYTCHTDLAAFQGKEPDQAAKVAFVTETQRDKSDEELYESLRPEEADLFDQVSNYKKRRNGKR